MIQYVGIPFKDMNCGDLALKVQSEIYGNNFDYSYVRPQSENVFAYSVAMKKNLFDFMEEEIKKPVDGCAVLMKIRGRLSHLGTYFKQNNTEYVLHTADQFGSSIIHKLCDLRKHNIDVEGFYKWKS